LPRLLIEVYEAQEGHLIFGIKSISMPSDITTVILDILILYVAQETNTM
jgi:hypothetical protein